MTAPQQQNNPMDESQKTGITDHDLIIRLDTKLDILTREVKSGNDNTKEQLVALGNNKLEKDQFHAWEIAHSEQTSLREKALQKQIDDERNERISQAKVFSDAIEELKASDQKLWNRQNYIAGGLAVITIIFTILGPVIAQAIIHAFKL